MGVGPCLLGSFALTAAEPDCAPIPLPADWRGSAPHCGLRCCAYTIGLPGWGRSHDPPIAQDIAEGHPEHEQGHRIAEGLVALDVPDHHHEDEQRASALE